MGAHRVRAPPARRLAPRSRSRPRSRVQPAAPASAGTAPGRKPVGGPGAGSRRSPGRRRREAAAVHAEAPCRQRRFPRPSSPRRRAGAWRPHTLAAPAARAASKRRDPSCAVAARCSATWKGLACCRLRTVCRPRRRTRRSCWIGHVVGASRRRRTSSPRCEPCSRSCTSGAIPHARWSRRCRPWPSAAAHCRGASTPLRWRCCSRAVSATARWAAKSSPPGLAGAARRGTLAPSPT
jgi:hypothetical protein